MSADTSEVLLRRATPADAEGIVALQKSVAMEGRWIRTQWPFDEAERVERYRAGIASERVLCIVAEQSGTIVGQFTMFPSEISAAFGITVDPATRRRGLGRRLLDAGEALVREGGFVTMELEVYAHNDAALALYRNAGFEEYGDRYSEPRASGETFEVVRMQKTVTASF